MAAAPLPNSFIPLLSVWPSFQSSNTNALTLSKLLQCRPSPIGPDMEACDPVWLRRMPDQRQRSSLGKTFELRMDGISIRKPFPLGSLVLGPRDRVTAQTTPT
ncbi:hypothetical protein NQZ68_029109 [Dissostichus eleginoides]|nr:hypothetical protein NQZ68_029109 [Dissostichus eleginoides]